ncbi:hypothetical protein G7Z17_g1044 [Cylindrodendrum hubeiense]|uniref:Methyltransferase domain-containing protein n=1 Tax=Cylindrodendrum hubeiense TaxID=595255 RepID=A0A9P5HKD7_9HYPO|nr:hypothetical protein G7Z17_g1044 [Cylindrodendrum hubeiense]
MTTNSSSTSSELWKVTMFQEKLPDDIQPFRNLLETYSNIPPDEVDDHLYRIRDKAWAVYKFPCIGRWHFVNVQALQGPGFQSLVARLKGPTSEDVFLDVGCCVGQTARKLAAEGVDPAKLYSTDLSQAFIDIGFELFRDQDRFPPGAFVAADMLDPDDAGAKTLDGKATIVSASNFFHLFSWEQQVRAASRIVGFMRPGASTTVIFGSQIGAVEACEVKALLGEGVRFLHDVSSLQKLWDEVGEKTATKWQVKAEIMKKMPFQIPGYPEDGVYLKYAVRPA